MERQQYGSGELILHQGDTGEFVYQLESGEVEIFLQHGDREIVVGSVGAGEFLGEMGAMGDHETRSASARARGDVTVTRLGREEFLQLVSRDVDTAYRVIRRLSERLRSVNHRLLESAPDVEPAATGATITIFPVGGAVQPWVPDTGLVVSKLPYVIGRSTDSMDLIDAPDLTIPDNKPYRLSRKHLALSKLRDDYVVYDLDSTLGTEVNGEPVGRHFGRDYQPLHRGENRVMAGGRASPFVFRITVED